MPRIISVRTVLLSAPWAYPGDLEVELHLPSGLKTVSLVEITLEDGTTGLGEGYLGTFAPKVFSAIVELVTPYLVGAEGFDIAARYRDLCRVTGYWSLQGAARHVISACEIALLDAKARYLGLPLYLLLGGSPVEKIKLYGSGGNSPDPEHMEQEFDALAEKGIDLFKIRARNHEPQKTAWTLNHAAARGINVGVDIAQNLANPAQSAGDVVDFTARVGRSSPHSIAFLEECLGPTDHENYPFLKSRLGIPLCGGETITTAVEMASLAKRRYFDFVQPDATVIGGIGQVLEVFNACRHNGSGCVVHAWGSAVCLMANYHAAFAGGGTLAEYPLPEFPLRRELLAEPLRITKGYLYPPAGTGLGVRLTPEIEREYSFREEAVYYCFPRKANLLPDENWQ